MDVLPKISGLRIKPCRGGYDYRTQRYKDANALYAFEGKGIVGETR